jgi:hypothetical protein
VTAVLAIVPLLSMLVSAAAPGAVRVVVAGADHPEELHRRLGDLIGPGWDVRGEIAATTEIAPADLFGPGDGTDALPAVWVLVGDGAARIRAADGPRQLFVFRDLAVATPLAELDRERIAQVANAALAAVLEGRPGALDRAAAARLLGVEPPRPAPPVEAPVAVAPPPVLPPAPIEKRWTGNVSYELQSSGRALFQGPGVALGVRVAGQEHAVTVTAQGQTYLPVVLLEGTIYQYVLRLLITFRFGRWAEAGLGGGIKYTGAEGGASNDVLVHWLQDYGPRSVTMPSGRIFVRAGPLALGGVRLSATVSLDVDASMNDFWAWYYSPPSRGRPAIALELWWR